jgi:predicted ATP-dependent endonuclease of OLD family
MHSVKTGLTPHSSYIDSVSIEGFFSIDSIELNDWKGAKEIYFLGENGDGKSLILMGIYLAFNHAFIEENTNPEFTGRIIHLIDENSYVNLSAVDCNGQNYRYHHHQYEYSNYKSTEQNLDYLSNFYAYGVHRGHYNSDDYEKYGIMSLFDDNQKLINPETWLKQLYFEELEQKVANAENGVNKSAKKGMSRKVIVELFTELLEKNVEIKVSAEGVKFIEKGFELSFNQLSEGYKNLMVWLSDLVFRLQQNQPLANSLQEFTGVVMVDEIELHLHPIWQRRLVGQLRHAFPNIQFIFTTHSPTMIQGAGEDAIIYRVYRDAKTGKTNVSEPYYKKHLNHLMLNSLITSPLFGLDDARLTNNPICPDTSDSYLQYRVSARVKAE